MRMPVRLDVRYPDGTCHTVAVAPHGRTAVGRDPACDLVLNHARVSRYHAVIEQSPAGLLIRDTQSVNGVYLNGRRVERAALVAGDQVRLGDVELLVVDETAAEHSPPQPSTPQVTLLGEPKAPLPGPASSSGDQRPLTLSVLATLWLVILPLSLASGIALGLLASAEGAHPVAASAGLALLALVAGLLGFGILARTRWLRVTHIAFCAVLAPTCLFTPFALITGMYLLHARTRAHFGGAPGLRDKRPPNEAAFTTAILGSLAAAAFVALAFFSGTRATPRLPYRSSWASTAGVVVERLRAMHTAEESFRQVCNVGYADLDALRRPASVLPGLPPGASPFVSEELALLESRGYHFELSVSGPMGATSDCATLRRYRTFRYTATPISGKGRHFLLLSDGSIHWSDDRPAQAEDPLAEVH